MILNFENYCISRCHKLFGQTTKQALNSFEPPKPWKYKQLWGMRPDPSCLWKNKHNIKPTDLWGKIQHEKIFFKIYVGYFKGFHDCTFDRK